MKSTDVDRLTSQFWDHGTNGVAELPDPDGSQDSVQLLAGFESKHAAEQVAALLEGTLLDGAPLDGTPPYQASVEPLDPSVWTGPAVREVTIPGATATIDAGHAFGHGDHATTQLICDTLGALVGPGTSFLDVGTGSGVLAILAKKLGADRVVGIDNDPAAIESATKNTATNNVDVQVTNAGLSELPSTFERFDLVVANMLLADLRPLAADILEMVGDTLVLSGFLEDQVEEVLEVFAPWRPVSQLEQDGWSCLVLR